MGGSCVRSESPNPSARVPHTVSCPGVGERSPRRGLCLKTRALESGSDGETGKAT